MLKRMAQRTFVKFGFIVGGRTDGIERRRSGRDPVAPAAPFAGWLEITGIAADAVVMDILAIRTALDLCLAADAEATLRTVLAELHLDLLSGQLRPAEASTEQSGWNAAVFLADPYLDPLVLAVYRAGIGQDLAGQGERQGQQEQAHGRFLWNGRATLARRGCPPLPPASSAAMGFPLCVKGFTMAGC